MLKKKNKKLGGFTLIELLVVISVITLLAAVILVAFNNSRQKARMARLGADLHQMQTQFDLVRDTQKKVLGDIAGNWCGLCAFNDTDPLKAQPAAIASNDQQWKNLGFPAGAPPDPWGNPYILDANEDESGFVECGRFDSVNSAGPNGIFESRSFVVDYIPPLPAIELSPIADDYFLWISLFRCTTPAIPG